MTMTFVLQFTCLVPERMEPILHSNYHTSITHVHRAICTHNPMAQVDKYSTLKDGYYRVGDKNDIKNKY